MNEKLPALGKPEKGGGKDDEKPEGEDEAISGFFESFFDCLYKAIEKWFPSDEDDTSKESSEDEESEDDESEDEDEKPSKKAPATPEAPEEKKKK